MKSLHHFASISSLAIATILVTALSSPAQTSPQIPTVPNTVLNGLLVNNASREFFEAGNEQFEAEIQTLQREELAQSDPLLTIRENARDLPADSPFDEWMEP